MNFNNFNQDFGQDDNGDVKRLLITVAVCSVLIFGYQALTRPSAEELAKAKAEREQAAQVEKTKSVEPAQKTDTNLVANPAAEAKATTPIVAESKASVSIEVAKAGEKQEGVRGGYKAEFTSKGAQVSSFILDGYTDNERVDEKTQKAPLVDLVSGKHEGVMLFALASNGGDVSLKADADYRLVTSEKDKIIYERESESGVVIRREYTFNPGSFVVNHKVSFENRSGNERRVAMDLRFVGQERPGERDSSALFGAYSDKLSAACRANDNREKEQSDALKEKKVQTGAVQYAAIDRHFFLASAAPVEGETAGCVMQSWTKTTGGVNSEGKPNANNGILLSLQHAPFALGAGETKSFEHAGFFGPKQLGLLKNAGHQLDENVDFGWFGVLSKPMLAVLVWLNGFTHNYGWAIVLLTMMMKLITFPLTQKSYVSMQQMKTVAPQLKELQKKYAHDKAKLGQAQMDLYKESGINPMAGCLPMLVQMPIWFALYRTLWNSVELYQQPFMLWINDLSQPDAFILGGFPLLPILVGVLMLGQTMFQPTPQDQPQMKYIMYLMPVFFSFMMLQMPSGLSVYMITNSMLTMIQQYYIRRKYGAPVEAAPAKKEAS